MGIKKINLQITEKYLVEESTQFRRGRIHETAEECEARMCSENGLNGKLRMFPKYDCLETFILQK